MTKPEHCLSCSLQMNNEATAESNWTVHASGSESDERKWAWLQNKNPARAVCLSEVSILITFYIFIIHKYNVKHCIKLYCIMKTSKYKKPKCNKLTQ